MSRVSSGDVQKNFGEYRLRAEEEPVHVSHYNKPSVVIVSAAEYERLKKRDKRSMATEELPEWLVDRIAAAEMRSEEHTSELQSLMRTSYAVFCLKKKKKPQTTKNTNI